MKILLDTHVLLWWQAGGQRLSSQAARAIARADAVLVSPISCWEVAMLVGRSRVTLDRDVNVWTRDLFDQERIEVAPISPQTGVGAALLGERGFHGDPADRFLYASAIDLLVPFVSKDENIHAFAATSGDVHVIW